MLKMQCKNKYCSTEVKTTQYGGCCSKSCQQSYEYAVIQARKLKQKQREEALIQEQTDFAKSQLESETSDKFSSETVTNPEVDTVNDAVKSDNSSTEPLNDEVKPDNDVVESVETVEYEDISVKEPESDNTYPTDTYTMEEEQPKPPKKRGRKPKAQTD